MRIDNLTHTERGYMQSTNFKTLVELDRFFERNHNYDRESCFGVIYHDYRVYLSEDDNAEAVYIRAIVKNGVKYITREMNHLLKILKIIN